MAGFLDDILKWKLLCQSSLRMVDKNMDQGCAFKSNMKPDAQNKQ